MNKKQIKEILKGYKGQKVVALVVNVTAVDDEFVHVLYKPDTENETIKIKKEKVKNWEDLKKKKFDKSAATVLIMDKSDNSEDQVPDVSQRPCPVTWIRIEQDGDDIDFDII